ncbi:MAG: hypothetical protein JO307_31200 [Bryobacterales bacterium]|nr:hypothetical protein [Bryobacterales bacterium]MBV9397654.1 hypothetical protein [Bryobacterales bacterium]
MSFKDMRRGSGRFKGPKTRTFFKLFTLTAGICVVSASAQNTMTSAVNELQRAGFGFYNLSVFGGYTNSTFPTVDSTGTINPNFAFHTLMTGVTASIGWRAKKSEHLHFDVRYTPSYYYQASSTGLHTSRFTPNQNLTLGWNQTFKTRWSMGANLVVVYSDYNQLLLLSDPNQIYAGIPGTPGEYATAVLSGSGTNAGLNAAAGASSVVAGQQNLLYGNRILSGAASFSLGYEVSPRLHLTGGFSGSRMQHLADNTAPQTPYLLQQSSTVSATLGLNYLLSERANLTGNMSYSRAISSLYSVPSMNIMIGAGYRLTEHLFVHGAGGAGYLLPITQGGVSTPFSRTQWQASAGLGYRILRQSFMGTVARTVSDNFGLNGSATLLASAGWGWSPLGSSWGITAGAAEVRLSGTNYGNQGYRVMAGLTRTVKSHIFMNLSYGYGAGNSLLPLAGTGLAATGLAGTRYSSQSHSVRLTIGIRPYLGSPIGIGASPAEGGGLQFP